MAIVPPARRGPSKPTHHVAAAAAAAAVTGEPGQQRGNRDRKDGRNRHGERQPGERQGGDENFKGMGDHVPAFLLRSLGKREDA